MEVVARCARCGRTAPAQVFEVTEWEYTGYGLDEPEGWYDVEHCGDPCVPSDLKTRHGPWPEHPDTTVGTVTSVLRDAYGLQVEYLLAPAFPVIEVDRPGKSIYYKYGKSDWRRTDVKGEQS